MALVGKALGLDPQKLTYDFLETALATNDPATSHLKNTVSDMLAESVVSAVNYTGRLSVTVPFFLDYTQQNELSAAFPELDIKFSQGNVNSHAIAAAERVCAHVILHHKVGLVRDVPKSMYPKHDSLVCDVGGNYALYLKQGLLAAHCDSPLLDPKDVPRHITRLDSISRILSKTDVDLAISGSQLKKVRKILEGLNNGNAVSNEYFCIDKAQNCSRTAKYGIGVHANYDIPLNVLGDIMVKKKMLQYFGCMIFHDSVLVQDEGRIPGVNCYFKYSADKKKIYFSFVDDDALTYIHDVSVYLSYFLVNSFYDSTKQYRFMIELQERRLGVVYFKVVRLLDGVPGRLEHFLWFWEMKNKSRVVFYQIDNDAVAARNLDKMFRQKVIFVENEIVDAVCAQAFAYTEQKFKPAMIFSYLMSFVRRQFFGNDITIRFKNMSFEDAVHLANAVYVYVYMMKYDVGKVVQQLILDVNFNRSYATLGLFGKLLDYKIFSRDNQNVFFETYGFIPKLSVLHKSLWKRQRAIRVLTPLIQKMGEIVRCDTGALASFSLFRKDPCQEMQSEPLMQLHMPENFSDSLSVNVDAVLSDVVSQNLGFDVSVFRTAGVLKQDLKTERINTPGKALRLRLPEYTMTFSSVALEVTPEVAQAMRQYQAVCDRNALLRERISQLDDEDYEQRKLILLPKLPEQPVICRAEFKLQDILQRFFPSKMFLNALDVCGGPGGFSCELLRRVSGEVYMHYYKQAAEGSVVNHAKLNSLNGSERLILLNCESDDFCEASTSESIVFRFEGKCELVVADGCVAHNVDAEAANLALVENECLLHQCLALHGNMVVKFMGLTMAATRDIIARTASLFNAFHLYRSRYASPISSEVYVIFEDYNPTKHNACLEVRYVKAMERVLLYAVSHAQALNEAYMDFLESHEKEGLESDEGYSEDEESTSDNNNFLVKEVDIQGQTIYYVECADTVKPPVYDPTILADEDEKLDQMLSQPYPQIKQVKPTGFRFKDLFCCFPTEDRSVEDDDVGSYCGTEMETLSDESGVDVSREEPFSNLHLEFDTISEVSVCEESPSFSSTLGSSCGELSMNVSSESGVSEILCEWVCEQTVDFESVVPGVADELLECFDSVYNRVFGVDDANLASSAVQCESLCDDVDAADDSVGELRDIVVEDFSRAESELLVAETSEFPLEDQVCLALPTVEQTRESGEDSNDSRVHVEPSQECHDDREINECVRDVLDSVLARVEGLVQVAQADHSTGDASTTDKTGVNQEKTDRSDARGRSRRHRRRRRNSSDSGKSTPTVEECLPGDSDVVVDTDVVRGQLDQLVLDARVVRLFSVKERLLMVTAEQGRYIEVTKDLFSLPRTISYAQCVARDSCMAAGIAPVFVKNFGVPRKPQARGVRVWVHKVSEKCNVFNLVTKEKSNEKPDVKDVRKAISGFFDLCARMEVEVVAMPLIACGLDQCDWREVSVCLREGVKRTGVCVIVCRTDLPKLGNVKGDGNCLLYSLVGAAIKMCNLRKLKKFLLDRMEPDPTVDVDNLRKILTSDYEWGEYDLIKVFSEVTNTEVVVVNSDVGNSFVVSRPGYFRRVGIFYENQHYSPYNLCQEPYSTVTSPLQKVANPSFFDVDALHSWLCAVDRVKLRLCRSLLELRRSAEPALFLSFTERCFSHQECQDGFIIPVIDYLLQKSVCAYVLFDLDVVDLKRVQLIAKQNQINWVIYNNKKLLEMNYALIFFSKTALTTNSDMKQCVNALITHNEVCKRCMKESRGPLYFCERLTARMPCRLGGFKVEYVRDHRAYSCKKIFLLRSKDGGAKLVIEGDRVCYYLPVCQQRVIDFKSVLDWESTLRKYLYDHACTTILLECGEFENVSGIIHFLSTFVYKLYVVADKYEAVKDSFGVKMPFEREVEESIVLKNSVVEYVKYLEISLQATKDTLEPIHQQALKMLQLVRAGRVWDIYGNKADYGLIDFTKGHYVIKPKIERSDSYQYGWDGKNFVNLEECFTNGRLVPTRGLGLVSVCRDTVLMPVFEILKRIGKFDLSALCPDFDIQLYDGVPGCGKTQFIVDNHDASPDLKEIVVTATRESALQIRERVIKKVPDRTRYSEKFLKLKYRTLDSILINYDAKTYGRTETLWVDEGLMVHFGAIVFLASIIGVTEVRICGDTAQIPFVSRIQSVCLRKEKIPLNYSRLKVINRMHSYRIPQDVAALLNESKVYAAQVTTSNPVERSMTVEYITGLAGVVCVKPGTVILTFTQSDKMELAHVYGKQFPVFTIHEFQGRQAEHVVLVRLMSKDIELFTKRAWQLVAITRHTRSLVYYTVRIDSLATWIRTQISQQALAAVRSTGCVATEVVKRGKKGAGGYVPSRQSPLFTVDVVPAQLKDKLYYSARRREFIEAHAGTAVVPMRVEINPAEVWLPEDPVFEYIPVPQPELLLQDIYDRLFPGASLVSTAHDRELFEYDYLPVKSKDFYIKELVPIPRPFYDCLSSSLRTSCPRNVFTTQKQVIKAFDERNGAVPDLTGLVNEKEIVDYLMMRFEETYVRDKGLFNMYESEPINPNPDSLEQWLREQPPGTWDAVEAEDLINIYDLELQRHQLIMKRVPKPKLEIGSENKFPSPQTIAHQEKTVNAIWCPVIKEIKKRFLAVLKYDKVVNMDMSVKDLEDILTFRFNPNVLKEYPYRLEVDMSKYDKSQNRVALLFKLRLLTKLGFPTYLLSTWQVSQVYTVLRCLLAGVTARVVYQQKSGNAATLFDNTTYLMATLSSVFDIQDALVLAVGDDSYIFSKRPLDSMLATDRLASLYNLEAKLLKFDTPYFCSKFLFITDTGCWKLVPDFAKVLTKLGRNDLRNYAHVEEYRRSCVDSFQAYRNEYYYPYISRALSDRYKLPRTDYSIFFRALATVVDDPALFKQLYYINDGAIINESVLQLPSLDI